MPHGCKFNELWLKDPKFSGWLKKNEKDLGTATCTKCNSNFKIDVTKDSQNDSDRCMREADKERNKDVKIRLFSKATKLRESALTKADELKELEKLVQIKFLLLISDSIIPWF